MILLYLLANCYERGENLDLNADLAMSRDFFGYYNSMHGEEGIRHLWLEARDAGKSLTIHGKVPTIKLIQPWVEVD
jgi:hypothetical protein